jgi:hypothetical protein
VKLVFAVLIRLRERWGKKQLSEVRTAPNSGIIPDLKSGLPIGLYGGIDQGLELLAKRRVRAVILQGI